MKTLGDRIRHHRKLKQLSQAELGKSVGLSQQMIGKLEQNQARYTNELPAIAEVLEVNLAYLMTGKGSQSIEAQNLSEFETLFARLSARQKSNLVILMRDMLRGASDQE